MRILLVLLACACVAGCVVEADRQAVDAAHRVLKMVEEKGAVPNDPVVHEAVRMTGVLQEHLGAPKSPLPELTVEALQTVTARIVTVIEQEQMRWTSLTQGAIAGGAALGIPGLGILIGLIIANRKKVRALAESVVEVGEEFKAGKPSGLTIGKLIEVITSGLGVAGDVKAAYADKVKTKKAA